MLIEVMPCCVGLKWNEGVKNLIFIFTEYYVKFCINNSLSMINSMTVMKVMGNFLISKNA